MPKKAARKTIVDVKRSDTVKPSASGRPIVVSNHPVIMHDPMVTADRPAEIVTAPTVTRAAKRIQPLHDLADVDTELAPTGPVVPVTAAAVPAAPEVEAPDGMPLKPDEAAPGEESPQPTTARHDPEADKLAAEAEQAAAQQARRQELEALVASGKYRVPINAVARKRSRMFVSLMTLLALLLAVALADAVLDAGLVHTSENVPHTHFFAS